MRSGSGSLGHSQQWRTGKGNFDRIGKADKEVVAHIATLRAMRFFNQQEYAFGGIDGLERFKFGHNAPLAMSDWAEKRHSGPEIYAASPCSGSMSSSSACQGRGGAQ